MAYHKRKKRDLGPFRSQFEKDFALHLYRLGVEFSYESEVIPYTIEHEYNPDFKIGNLIIETKGLFNQADRAKHLAVKRQHPELDIRIVFQRDNKINNKSKTRYSDWCKKHDFIYHIGDGIPEQWLSDVSKKINRRRARAAPKGKN